MKFYASFFDKVPPYPFHKLLRVMRLVFLFVFAALMQVYAAGRAQNVSIAAKNSSLAEVFKSLKQQTGIKFLYNPDMLDHAKPVTLSLSNRPLSEVLDACFQGQQLSYTIFQGNIVVSEKPRSVFDKIEMALEQVTIAGVIKDDQGQPIPGVTIKEKGGTHVVISGDGGDFRMVVSNQQATIILSYIGYETIEVPADKLLKPSVLTMKPNQVSLKEVVINKGYYSTTRELNTGNVSSVSSATIEQQPVSNPLAALEGQVAGLFITQTTGMPGGGFTVQIRGQNSIANGNEPFYVIDGVPYLSSPQLAANNNISTAGVNPLNFINTHDIESIEVLKDADATAIYGSRGANGVVLITTKKGKMGQTKFDFNVYEGVGKLTHNLQYLTTPQYLEVRKEALKNDGATADPTIDYDILGTNGWDTTRTLDWGKRLLGGTAHYTDAQGSLSGGNEFTQFMIGGGYHRETTVFPGTSADQKGSLHFSISNSSRNKKFHMVFSGNYVLDQSNLPAVQPLSQFFYLAPTNPDPFNADGSLNWGDGTFSNNPLAYFKQTFSGRTTNLVSNLLLSYNILPGLEARTSLGYTNMQTDQKALYPLTSVDPSLGLTSGSSEFSNINTRSWVIEPQLSYKLKLGRGQFSALIGTTFQQNRNQGTTLIGDGFTSDALIGDLQAASSITPLNVTDIVYKYNAVYGRLNYTYDDKYVINVTARRDGSSRFGPGKQFANFGAAGAAWIFSKENWAKDNLGFLSLGKLRASYGTSGNDQIPDYTFFDRYATTRFPYSGTQGIYPVSFYNPDLAWEVNKKMEAGLELGFLNDRVNFTGSYYRNRSSNQLLGYPLSAVTGFSSITENLPAIVQNKGWEFTVNAAIVKNRRFKWSSSLNLTIPQNKLVAYPGLAASSYRNQFIIGQPITIQRVYQFEGVNPQTGLYQFLGADGKLTSAPIAVTDATRIVNTAPKFYGGYQNSFGYGNLSLDFLLQFVKQTGIYYTYNNPGYFSTLEPETVLDRWQKPGDIKPIQRYSQNGSTDIAAAAAGRSDQLYKDASYIRLKNLSLSYTIPGAWRQTIGVQNARIYLQGQNLFTITNYKGYDPENQSVFTLPPLKVWTIGLQITL